MKKTNIASEWREITEMIDRANLPDPDGTSAYAKYSYASGLAVALNVLCEDLEAVANPAMNKKISRFKKDLNQLLK